VRRSWKLVVVALQSISRNGSLCGKLLVESA
jgi:hypothetical protein